MAASLPPFFPPVSVFYISRSTPTLRRRTSFYYYSFFLSLLHSSGTAMGAEKENFVRVTRAAAKKREAAGVEALTRNGKRKRIALEEIRNLYDSVGDSGPVAEKAKRPKARGKQLQKQGKEVVVDEGEIGVDGASVVNNIQPGFADPQICTEYASGIHLYLRAMEAESKRRPLANYIGTIQKDVTANMRAILVAWLVEVAEEYQLVPETLYLSVSYIDRFLSRNTMDKKRLQLLGVASMLIASKYEEIDPPHVEDFCDITDNTYSKEEVVKMEADILKALSFEMGNPTTNTFLRRLIEAGAAGQDGIKPSSLELEFLGCYLAELSLLDYGCLGFLPSMLSASAVFVARFTQNPRTHPWNSTLEHYTSYKPSQLKDSIHAIHHLQLNKKGANFVAIQDKYKHHKFKCVATMVSPSEIPSFYFEDIYSPKE